MGTGLPRPLLEVGDQFATHRRHLIVVATTLAGNEPKVIRIIEQLLFQQIRKHALEVTRLFAAESDMGQPCTGDTDNHSDFAALAGSQRLTQRKPLYGFTVAGLVQHRAVRLPFGFPGAGKVNQGSICHANPSFHHYSSACATL